MRTDGLYKLTMPTAKEKGGSAPHRYRPASEYDDATLIQKRQYWRTKKREQRARLTERRDKSTPDSRGGKLLHLHAPATVNSTLSGSLATFSSPLQSKNDSYKKVSIASQSGNTAESSSVKASENQRGMWLHSVKLNRVLPASCSISAKAATVKCSTTRGAVSRAVTSATPSGPQLNTRSSVPLARVTRTTNGSSAKPPQPCVSMQGASVSRMQQKAQVALGIQPKLLPTSVTTGVILVSSPCVPVSIKTEDKTVNTSPQSGTKCALVTLQRAKGVSKPQSSLEPGEERAAKRREQWRIKKREQRAKQAKARERTQNAETMARKTGLVGHPPSQLFLRGAGQKQCPARVRISTKMENDKLQSGAASSVTVNLQAERIKVQKLHGSRTTQTAVTCDDISVRKPGESQRVHLSNVTRGIARCKTPRQRFVEVQRTFTNQRNTRCKSLLLASVFGNRNIPQIDPNDTPEQIVAKRREYWRIKKREQRAKQSMEMKARLKEKDALMRRVKRYHSILEEMRRARVLAQSTGTTLSHASETIGGFIKEDGTVTTNIPQVPTDHITAAHKSEEECHVDPNNTPITKRVTQPPPALRPAQVKVSFPLAGQLVSQPPALSVRPRTQLESTTIPNSHKLATQTVPQLTLTHPQTPQNAFSGGPTAGSNLGGCVMKMVVSSSAPSLSALCLDPELSEEERMAKKREYWRIKKREQRAARAAQLRQGVLQARAHATLQRRRAQKLVAVSTVPLGRGLANRTGSAQPLRHNSRPVTPHANEIKRESESMPAVDLHSQPEQAICPDIKAPASPPPPPPPDPQPEPDPAQSADSQATTLLAVASMKKLLEESLSTVTECSTEQQTDIKIESTEEASEQEVEPSVPLDEVAPVAADLTLEIKSWQSDTDTLVEAGLPSPPLKHSPQNSNTFPPFPTSNHVVLHPTCEHSSQTPSNFIVNPSDVPASPRRTLRLRTSKANHQSSCSPEPPKLHHLPMDHPQQHQTQAPEQCQNSPSAQGCVRVVTEHSSVVSLQRKREYWKLMKRQQRARLRARQRERQGESSKRSSQAPAVAAVMDTVKGVNGPVLQPKPSSASLTAGTSIPTVLLVSPTSCSTNQSPDTLQVKLPVTSVSRSRRSEQNYVGPSQIVSDNQGAHENPQQAMLASRKWMTKSTDLDPAPSLPTLKPPDDTVSSINLHPIEPLHTPDTLSPIKIPCAQLQSPEHVIQSPIKLAPLTTMVPPKPIPGEPEEDFLKRKREYWRIKKKEQRARKAIQDKGLSPRRAYNSVRPIMPTQETQTQVPGQWVSSSDELDLMSTSEDTDPGSFSFPSYTAPLEDESQLLFAGYESSNGEEDPVSDSVWRNHYLMDYDPLNQLLVCMVCGELQYSHSLEGVRAHIDEAHPDTLSLEPREQQRILEAWDEQVSQRERFFTSQLQQHSGALAEAHGD